MQCKTSVAKSRIYICVVQYPLAEGMRLCVRTSLNKIESGLIPVRHMQNENSKYLVFLFNLAVELMTWDEATLNENGI